MHLPGFGVSYNAIDSDMNYSLIVEYLLMGLRIMACPVPDLRTCLFLRKIVGSLSTNCCKGVICLYNMSTFRLLVL